MIGLAERRPPADTVPVAGAHPHSHQPEVRRRPPPTRRREHAFTLVELLVVLVIVGIAVGFVATTMFTGRTSSSRAAAVASARAVGDAIDDFRKDHGGRPPTLGNARDWPNPVMNGPRHRFSQRPYMRRGAPDALRNGVAMLVGPAGTATGTTRWSLQYAPSTAGAGGWSITVRDRRGAAPACSIGGGQLARLPERAC